jgi:hypothetical protein
MVLDQCRQLQHDLLPDENAQSALVGGAYRSIDGYAAPYAILVALAAR